MALAGVNSLNNSTSKSQAYTATNLESRIDHASAKTLDVDWNGSQKHDCDSAIDNGRSSNAQNAAGEDVLPEVDVAILDHGGGNRCNGADGHADDEQVFRVEDFKHAGHGQRENKARAAHGEEAERSLASAQVVDLLSNQSRVVDDRLVSAIHD